MSLFTSEHKWDGQYSSLIRHPGPNTLQSVSRCFSEILSPKSQIASLDENLLSQVEHKTLGFKKVRLYKNPVCNKLIVALEKLIFMAFQATQAWTSPWACHLVVMVKLVCLIDPKCYAGWQGRSCLDGKYISAYHNFPEIYKKKAKGRVVLNVIGCL